MECRGPNLTYIGMQVILLLWDTPLGGEAEEVLMTEERGVWSAQVH